MTAALNEAAVAACGAAANYHEDTDWSEVARAVLMAVREPDDDMKESAGWSEYDAGCWAEGIDAILGENK